MLTLFSRIIEQDRAKEMLRRAMAGDKLAHAYLFRGPAGVGKKTAAHALAATLNCVTARQRRTFGRLARLAYLGYAAPGQTPESAPLPGGYASVATEPTDTEPIAPTDSLEACGHCPSCRKFAAGSHPDFLEILPEGAGIKIGQVREVKKALSYPPLEAGRRVVMLGEVHTMRREAANSLLKSLEEPPADTIFILTGDEAGGILPTIISRCQIVPFYPLPVDTLATELSRQHQLAPEAATTLSAVAEGSLGRARQLMEKDLLELRRRVLTMLLSREAGQPEAVAEVLYWADKCAQLKNDLDDFLDLLASCYHDLAVLTTITAAAGSAADPAPEHRVINRDLLPLLTDAAAQLDFLHLDHCRQQFRQAKSRLKRNCSRAMVCEVLFFALL